MCKASQAVGQYSVQAFITLSPATQLTAGLHKQLHCQKLSLPASSSSSESQAALFRLALVAHAWSLKPAVAWQPGACLMFCSNTSAGLLHRCCLVTAPGCCPNSVQDPRSTFESFTALHRPGVPGCWQPSDWWVTSAALLSSMLAASASALHFLRALNTLQWVSST